MSPQKRPGRCVWGGVEGGWQERAESTLHAAHSPVRVWRVSGAHRLRRPTAQPPTPALPFIAMQPGARGLTSLCLAAASAKGDCKEYLPERVVMMLSEFIYTTHLKR